jgi:hypothetical protein
MCECVPQRRESAHHDTDLALLTLVWPLGADVPIPQSAQREIVQRVESELLGTRGVVRYAADTYNACHDSPPEWTMGWDSSLSAGTRSAIWSVRSTTTGGWRRRRPTPASCPVSRCRARPALQLTSLLVVRASRGLGGATE